MILLTYNIQLLTNNTQKAITYLIKAFNNWQKGVTYLIKAFNNIKKANAYS
jgi:hypothetical protein